MNYSQVKQFYRWRFRPSLQSQIYSVIVGLSFKTLHKINDFCCWISTVGCMRALSLSVCLSSDASEQSCSVNASDETTTENLLNKTKRRRSANLRTTTTKGNKALLWSAAGGMSAAIRTCWPWRKWIAIGLASAAAAQEKDEHLLASPGMRRRRRYGKRGWWLLFCWCCLWLRTHQN